MKSKIRPIGPKLKELCYDFGFGKLEIIISKLPITSEDYAKKCQEAMKSNGIDQKSAESLIQNKLIQIESFNKIMDHISKLFEYDINHEDLENQIKLIWKNPIFNNINPEDKDQLIKTLAKKLIIKKMIFNYFISNYNQLDVSRKEAELFLSNSGLLKDSSLQKKEDEIIKFQESSIENKIIDWLTKQYKIIIKLA